jgi:hypothetical protein
VTRIRQVVGFAGAIRPIRKTLDQLHARARSFLRRPAPTRARSALDLRRFDGSLRHAREHLDPFSR